MADLPEEFKACAKKFETAAYKNVNVGRGFTAIDAYHIVERLTEVFGLCGLGWGTESVAYELHDKNVAARGTFWFMVGEKRGAIESVGDAVVFKGNIAEAYKKAHTNLISKASSFLCIGLSVYQGKGLEDPYLDRAHAANKDSTPSPAARKPNKTDVATVEQWIVMSGLCRDRFVTEEELMKRLSEEPFCCKSRRELLANHVPKLTAWIKGEE
ncbi:MAG: hypothetical protein GY851_35425 [bacterium]|nr:hypothetical protein [bacterium]